LNAVNRDEALAVCGSGIEQAVEKMRGINPALKLIVTAGGDGCYLHDGGELLHVPCIPAPVVSTAGAGDALLGGTVAALINGKNFREAVKYGTVVARFAVLSPHTIAGEVSLEKVENFIQGERT
jgi:sugar/nucleoside kinase (ribokinase family)